ncbi:unnamed protein product, partial [Ectocarpus sp. 12 AP-2014]
PRGFQKKNACVHRKTILPVQDRIEGEIYPQVITVSGRKFIISGKDGEIVANGARDARLSSGPEKSARSVSYHGPCNLPPFAMAQLHSSLVTRTQTGGNPTFRCDNTATLLVTCPSTHDPVAHPFSLSPTTFT